MFKRLNVKKNAGRKVSVYFILQFFFILVLFFRIFFLFAHVVIAFHEASVGITDEA